MAFDVAFQAMEELTRLAQIGEPLWSQGMDPTTYVLNEEEYLRTFPTAFGLRPPVFRCEASRQTVLVMISNTDLVQILMDVVCLLYYTQKKRLAKRKPHFVIDTNWLSYHLHFNDINRINGLLRLLISSQKLQPSKSYQLEYQEIIMEPCKW